MFWSWNSGKTKTPPLPGDVLQADARGVPQWARTTGEILPFHGAPKTPGFPHYLDGLPMSVVSQLGYVDRGIGKRGIAVFVDDFLYGSAGREDTDSTDEQISDARWVAVHDAGYALLSRQTYPYFSGALTLVTYGGETPATHKGIGVTGRLRAFHFLPGRQLWFTTRVALLPESGASLVPGLAAIGLGAATGSTMDDKFGGANGLEGLVFYKAEGEADWSFGVGEYSGVEATFAVLATHLVETALGAPPVGDRYVPLAFRVLPDATILVYVDGNVVTAIPASQPQWALLRSYQTEAPSALPFMYAELGDSHPVSVDDSHQIGLRLAVDNILVAEETQADAD